jgi:hypothetical protein
MKYSSKIGLAIAAKSLAVRTRDGISIEEEQRQKRKEAHFHGNPPLLFPLGFSFIEIISLRAGQEKKRSSGLSNVLPLLNYDTNLFIP